MKWLYLILAAFLLLWAGSTSVVFVDQTEHVFITQFGKPVQSYDGKTEAGLKVKFPWPVNAALRFDRRLQVFDLPTQELLIRDTDEQTGEQKSLPMTFDLYVCWHIGSKSQSDDPLDQFIRSFGSLERAEDFLRSEIISRLKVELSDLPLDQLVNTDRQKLRGTAMMEQLRDRPYVRVMGEQPLSLTARVRQVGIELVDVRLRRFNHPIQVRDEIFAKIREDRKREANNYRLQGEENAAKIRYQGELEAKRIRAEADKSRIQFEGSARAASTRILNQAHQQAPEFYRIVRMLDGYKKMFADERTQLILSLDHPLLKLFSEIPEMRGSEQ